jgi:DNA replication licensing factor MCM7
MRLCSAYIALARRCRPVVPADVSSYIVESYVRLRKQSKDDAQLERSHTHTSARTLLGVLRLAQALARLRFATAVLHADVDEALRLMAASKESLHDDAEDGDARGADRSDTSRIYRIIKDMAEAAVAAGAGRSLRKRPRRLGRGPDRERDMMEDGEGDAVLDSLSMVDIRARVLSAGYTEAQLMTTIQEVGLYYYCYLFAETDISVTSVLSTRISTFGRAWRTAQS